MAAPKGIRNRNLSYEGMGITEEGTWKGPFCFIQGADTQYGMFDNYIDKKPRDQVRWDREIALTRKAIAAANRMMPRPKFFIICGDLVDAFQDDMELRRAQEDDFRKEFSKLESEIPLVCVCGNHDVGNIPTPESMQHYRKTMGDDYFTFWAGGCFCIVLNSQFFYKDDLVKDEAAKQVEWLNHRLDEIKKNGCKYCFVFQHIPWFLKEADEPDEYFNMPLSFRLKWLQRFREAGVKTIFCGHYHRNAGGFYQGDLECVVTSAMGATLGNDSSGLRVVRVLETDVKHDYYPMDQIPQVVQLDLNLEFRIRNRNYSYEGMGKAEEGKWNGPFYFIQGADTQYGMFDRYIDGKPIGQIKWDREISLTRKAIEAVHRMKPLPKFFVICGDLVDAFQETIELRKAQEDDFRKEFSKLRSEIPLVCVCGNHDVGEIPTSESVQHYRKTMGDDYFTFWAGGCYCIVLNSQFFYKDDLVKDEAAKQVAWLNHRLDEIKKNGCKYCFVFQHIPWFLKEADEPDEYFNMPLSFRLKWLQRFREAGVKTIFCGHYHRNAGGFYQGDLECVVTSAMGATLGNDSSGLRVVRVLETDVKHDYFLMDQIPQVVKLE